MNLIIPMAGKGKRLRPHTLTVPKPLIPIAGKPVVERLVQDIAKVCPEPIKKIGFVIGDFDEWIKAALLSIAKSVGAEGVIYNQKEALGTAHAVFCAKELMQGKTLIAFADTLFKANFTLNTESDGIIWVKAVDDPNAYGVVKVNDEGTITDFVEKPKDYISDLAIIGIYYFKQGEKLAQEIDWLIKNKILKKGEYQLTDALERLKEKDTKFTTGKVEAWHDCGNKNVIVKTNSIYLTYLSEDKLTSPEVEVVDSIIIQPTYLGKGAKIVNSIIGPYTSVGDNTTVENCRIDRSLIQNNTNLNGVYLSNSMVGNFVEYSNIPQDVSIGDYVNVKG
ncbi:MAG TPA: sugar phosphate nucleotidyltransferase [Cyclobacteriaceae bacterium]